MDFSHARPQTFLFVTPANKTMGWIGAVLAQGKAGANWVWQGLCQGFRGVQLVGAVLEQGHLGRKKGGAFSGTAIGQDAHMYISFLCIGCWMLSFY